MDASKNSKLLEKEMAREKDDGLKSPEREKKISASDVTRFYAVTSPEILPGDEKYVFDDLPSAINCCKKLTSKNGRFKVFTSREEACLFASSPSQNSAQKVPSESLANVPEDKSSNLPSVSSLQLVVLRRDIENGRNSEVLDKIWSNPRYLIGNSDSPTILHEGTRYNAFHVAAKARQTHIFYNLLNTVKDFRFLSLLHPEKSSAKLVDLQSHLVDLSLNMPCKPMNETPLHVASKFGAVGIVQIMLSFDICERKTNKHGKLPEQLMCERCPRDDRELKSQMQAVFEGEFKFYVPFLKDPLNSGFSCVGALVKEHSVAAFISSRGKIDTKPVDGGCPEYGAFAGPMNKHLAEQFIGALKKKNFGNNFPLTPDQQFKLKTIFFSDLSKGLERVGRLLACKMDCNYLEFFSALDDYISLKTGLGVLECYLECFGKLNHLKSTLSKHELDVPEKCRYFVSFLDDHVLDAICERLKRGMDLSDFLKTGRVTAEFYLVFLFEDIIPNILCLTLTSFEAEDCKNLLLIHNEIAHLLLLKSSKILDETALHALVMNLNSVLYGLKDFHSKNYQQFLCILKFFCFHHFDVKNSVGGDTAETNLLHFLCSTKPVCSCFVTSPPLETFFSFPSSIFLSCLLVQKQTYNETAKASFCMQDLLQSLTADDVAASGDDRDSSMSLQKPLEEEEDSDSDSSFHLASEYCKFYVPDIIEMYIDGTGVCSSRDIDIYRWLEKVPIHEATYPHVFRYKNLVECKFMAVMQGRVNITPEASSCAIERCFLRKKVIKGRKTLFV